MDVPGQAEVSDLHDVALCDQDVPGCQVSVYTLVWREWESEGGSQGGKSEGKRRIRQLPHPINKSTLKQVYT